MFALQARNYLHPAGTASSYGFIPEAPSIAEVHGIITVSNQRESGQFSRIINTLGNKLGPLVD